MNETLGEVTVCAHMSAPYAINLIWYIFGFPKYHYNVFLKDFICVWKIYVNVISYMTSKNRLKPHFGDFREPIGKKIVNQNNFYQTFRYLRLICKICWICNKIQHIYFQIWHLKHSYDTIYQNKLKNISLCTKQLIW